MSRVPSLLFTIVPSMVAGGLLFATTFGHAQTGPDDTAAAWQAAPDEAAFAEAPERVAQADPWARTRPRVPPAPPAPPSAAVPPAPPAPPSPPSHGRGFSVSFRDGKIEVDGIADLVQNQLEGVADMLDNLPGDVPADVRTALQARLRAVRSRVSMRLAHLKSMDVDQIGPEMERMGEEIEQAMEGLDRDLEQLGDKLGRDLASRLTRDLARSFDVRRMNPGHDMNSGDAPADDEDDLGAVELPPDGDAALIDPAAVAGLRNLALDPVQRAELASVRAASERQIADARRELDELSKQLHDSLRDDRASEAEIARQIDLVSAQEAAIRKARILAWVRARGVLHSEQRKMIEAAAHKGR